MSSDAVLFVDDQPLRSVPLRAHLALAGAPLRSAPCGFAALAGAPVATGDLLLVCLRRPSQWAMWLAHHTHLEHRKAIALFQSELRLDPDRLGAAGFAASLPLEQAPAHLALSLTRRLNGSLPAAAPEEDEYLSLLPLFDDDAAKTATLGDEAMLEELRAMLVEDLVHRMPLIDEHLAAGDLEATSAQVHRMIGGCGYCGASALRSLCLELEDALRNADRDHLAECYQRWLACGLKVIATLRGAPPTPADGDPTGG